VKLRNSRISVPTEGVWLEGELAHAPDVRALAVLLQPGHVEGDRTSAATGAATVLQQSGLATLLIELVTAHEASRDPDACFNVPQMTNRLLGVLDWVSHQPALAGLPIGLVGWSTASAVAVRASWKAPKCCDAIVCRSGRPDLAGATPLKLLSVPIRFVVGSEESSLDIARRAFDLMGGEKDWQVARDAGEAFVEPGDVDTFGRLAGEWLNAKLPKRDWGAQIPQPCNVPPSAAV
jgi:putative phosphoribosyl transferase